MTDVFAARVEDLADGDSIVLHASAMAKLTVIAGTGATVTVSRVDDKTAGSHTSGSQNQFTVSADSRSITDVDWPYYRISTSGGSARVALV